MRREELSALLRRALERALAHERLRLALATLHRRPDAVLVGAVVLGVVAMILHWS